MVNTNRFYRLVWRFNAVAIMLTTIMAIPILGFLSTAVYYKATDGRGVRLNPGRCLSSTTNWKFGKMESIGGTSYVAIPLYSAQTDADSSAEEDDKPARNMLFIDTKGSDRHWLFDKDEYLIAKYSLIADGPVWEEGSVVKAILYSVRKNHRDSGELDSIRALLKLGPPKSFVALSTPTGQNYKVILPRIDKLLGHKLVDGDSILLLYEKQNAAYSAGVRLSDFCTVSRSKLPRFENGP